MKVTSEGQITIPPDIRERFHLFPGTDVEFLPQGESVLIRAVTEKTRFQQWIDRAQGSAISRLTTDEMMTATRGED
jgi:AbrB family looped-hinge helix DNA binding protein